MVEEIHQTDGQPEHPSVRYEQTDASFRAIFLIILGTMALAAVIHMAIWAFFLDYRGYEDAIKKSPYPLAPTPSTELPKTPRLEQVERTLPPWTPDRVKTPNIYEQMASEEKILESYGKTEEKGFVHIPIERAMKLLLENKENKDNPLRARAAPPEQAERSRGLVDAGESNSGRMFRKGAQ